MLSLVILEALGASAKDIRRTLVKEGIRGAQEAPFDCPIACYLNRLGYRDANVDAVTISVLIDDPENPDGFLCIATPGPCVELSKFDEGRYPELVK